MRALRRGLIALGAILLPGTAAAQMAMMQIICAPAAPLLKELAEHGETPVVMGMLEGGAQMVAVHASSGGSWTLTLQNAAEGTICMIAAGEGVEVNPLPPAGTKH